MSVTAKDIYQVLTATGLPVFYGYIPEPTPAPYIVYLGAGQDNFAADNRFYFSRNNYQIEYYFKTKDEATEARIEEALQTAGLPYEKSGDSYIDSEGLFVLYYQI